MSLRTRLIAAATVWIIAGVFVGGLLLSAIFKEHVTAQFYDELYVHLDELQRLAEIKPNGAFLQRNLSDPRYDVPLSGYYWEIQSGATVLARSKSLEGPVLATPEDGPADVGVHTHTVAGPTGTLLVAERAKWIDPTGNPISFLIGTDKRHLDSVLHAFDRTVGYSLAAFAALMIGAAALLILYAMRPLDQLRQSLGRVHSGQSPTLVGTFPTELLPLVNDLNSLLASTADLIQRARTQAGNIAHGLKTPLAILTDEAYRIQEQGLEQSSKIVFDQCRQMQTHIDYQITRARAVAMRSTPGMVASVSVVAEEVSSALVRLHQDRNVLLKNDVPAGASVACDRQDLSEILANVVDNAFKHAATRVHLSLAKPADPCMTRITVEDDGAGLPPEAYDVVFEIGERWDSQSPGTGLGLAIVRDLCRLYGGDVELSPSSLGGLSVAITLPRVAHHERGK